MYTWLPRIFLPFAVWTYLCHDIKVQDQRWFEHNLQYPAVKQCLKWMVVCGKFLQSSDVLNCKWRTGFSLRCSPNGISLLSAIHSIMQRMRTPAPRCRGATSVILPPETPFARRAVWPRPLGQATDRWLVAAVTPWSPAATEEAGLLPREQRRPALPSSPCGERPWYTGLLSDRSISGGFRGR